ncbi:hypothetical protein ON010_g14113 [Phytophthora cinnamomi]|nr:hypothetical protein ON010_g14113 [Phytophthora cinnamomi]
MAYLQEHARNGLVGLIVEADRVYDDDTVCLGEHVDGLIATVRDLNRAEGARVSILQRLEALLEWSAQNVALQHRDALNERSCRKDTEVQVSDQLQHITGIKKKTPDTRTGIGRSDHVHVDLQREVETRLRSDELELRVRHGEHLLGTQSIHASPPS